MTRDVHHRPELSVIVPVRNEGAYIRDVLEQLLGQTLAPEAYEIIVVDGMSEDDTREVVASVMAEHPNVRLLDNPGGLSGSGRNVGAEHSEAPYLLLVDGHCRISSPDMLASVLQAFTDGALCVSRPQPPIRDGVSRFQAATALWWY